MCVWQKQKVLVYDKRVFAKNKKVFVFGKHAFVINENFLFLTHKSCVFGKRVFTKQQFDLSFLYCLAT
jgi:hypothetical protein